MRERPILFSAPMVRAILEGHKTVTRRVAKLNYAGRVALRGRQWHVDDPNAFLACPYGVPGDRLWVREAWWYYDQAAFDAREIEGVVYRADQSDASLRDERRLVKRKEDRWCSPIHMPRWASRITLEVVSVRVERVQSIAALDAAAEGTTHSGFRLLWDSLNAKRGYGWDANPWVWRIEFKRIANDEREG